MTPLPTSVPVAGTLTLPVSRKATRQDTTSGGALSASSTSIQCPPFMALTRRPSFHSKAEEEEEEQV